MKFVRRALAILSSTALATAVTPAFAAGTANAGFSVNVNVSNTCTIAFSSSTAVTINYTGTSGAAVNSNLPFTTSCTGGGVPYTLALTNAAGTAQTTDTVAGTSSGVDYTLTLLNVAATVHPTGNGSVTSFNSGTPQNSLKVNVTAAADQVSASCASGSSCATSNSHTVVMSY